MTTTTPVTTETLTAFVALLQKPIDAHTAAMNIPGNIGTKIGYELGKRYAKLIAHAGNGQRSAFGFVDMTTGDVYKAASWRGPERNFVRGNVHTMTESKWIYSIR